jgi:hypothetical protein
MQKVFSYTTSWRPEYYYFTINQDVILHEVIFFYPPILWLAKLVNIHKKIEPNLAIDKTWK